MTEISQNLREAVMDQIYERLRAYEPQLPPAAAVREELIRVQR